VEDCFLQAELSGLGFANSISLGRQRHPEETANLDLIIDDQGCHGKAVLPQ